MLHILNELRVLKASAQAQESSSPPFWRRFSRSAWPNELPQGVGGDWDGWSSVPDLQQDWDAKHKESVMLALQAQYTRAGLKMPDSWQSLQCHNCRVVTVGHQLVLAGGPAFFHHKILTAIRVARGLSKTSGQPIVPLFWMASEDHDWKEISSVHGVNQAHSWTPRHSHIPRPVGQLSLDGLGEVLQEWMADGLSDQIATDMWTDFEASVAAGECLSGLMRRWLHRWYGSDGLLVLDPQDEDLKTLGASLWAKEFEGRGVHDALHGSAAMDGPALVRENNIFWMDEERGRVGVVRENMETDGRRERWVLRRLRRDGCHGLRSTRDRAALVSSFAPCTKNCSFKVQRWWWGQVNGITGCSCHRPFRSTDCPFQLCV